MKSQTVGYGVIFLVALACAFVVAFRAALFRKPPEF